MSLRKSALIGSSIVALATSVSVPVSMHLYDQREKTIRKISEAISNFDGRPGTTEKDWEILYTKLGECYANNQPKYGTHLKALYEIEERLPQIIEEMRR